MTTAAVEAAAMPEHGRGEPDRDAHEECDERPHHIDPPLTDKSLIAIPAFVFAGACVAEFGAVQTNGTPIAWVRLRPAALTGLQGRGAVHPSQSPAIRSAGARLPE
jgi:hypothetical protein